MPNKDTNKVDTLPLHIIGEIDAMLLSGEYSILSIVGYLEKEHGIKLDRETLSKYKKRLEERYTESPNNKQEIVQVDDAENNTQKTQVILNPRDMLNQLINENFARVQEIRKMNGRRFDPRWESFINSYSDNIRKIIETLYKLDENFDDNIKIENIVRSHLSKIIKCVHETIKIVCPEKTNEFKHILSQKYKEEIKQLENKNATND